MLIPALLMGNVAVLKLPAVGGLVHVLTADAIAAALPAGVVNFVSGSGRKTMGPIMATGPPRRLAPRASPSRLLLMPSRLPAGPSRPWLARTRTRSG